MIETMRWTRDEYVSLMTYQSPPRPMLVELFGPLVGLEEEWRDQGASPAELDLTAFEFDYVPLHHVGVATGPTRLPERVIEDSPTHQVKIDYLGRRARLDKRTATIHLPETFPVKTMDDWLAIKPRFAFGDWRITPEAIDRAKRAREEGAYLTTRIPGSFDTLRELMGEENACLAYYEQPELVADLIKTLTDTATRVLGQTCAQVQVDQLSVHEDFAGRSGPMIGPGLIDQTLSPLYNAAWEIVRAAGGKVFQLDTDGNINAVVDALLACGLTCIYPMEPAAGMDTVKVRQTYGQRLAFLGGIDKHVLRQSKSDIRRELEYKLRPDIWRAGGAVFGLDHRIPNGTPLEHYRYYVDTAREILELPPRTGVPGEWRRMAS